MADTFTQLPTQFTDPRSPHYDPSRFVSGGKMWDVDYKGDIWQDIPRSEDSFNEGGSGGIKMTSGDYYQDVAYGLIDPNIPDPVNQQPTGILGVLGALLGSILGGPFDPNSNTGQQKANNINWQNALGPKKTPTQKTSPGIAGTADSPSQYYTADERDAIIKGLGNDPAALIGPDDDPNTANSIAYDANGITVKMPNRRALEQRSNQYKPQRALESIGYNRMR